MGPKTRSVLFCLLFLGTAEIAYRAIESAPARDSAPVVIRDPILFLLGTSRTETAIRPALVEQALEARGVENPWVAIVGREAATNVGLHQHYMRQLHWLVEGGELVGFVAIEVRGSAMNDSFLNPHEERYLAREVFAPLEPAASGEPRPQEDAGTPPAEPAHGQARSAWQKLCKGDINGSARSLLGSVHLFRGQTEFRETMETWMRRRRATPEAASANQDDSDQGKILQQLSGASWTQAERGWKPFDNAPRSDLSVERWKSRYDSLLRDYALGGVQTEFLRRLVRQVRRDGLTPILYLMPITPIHRGFYAPGDYDAFLELVRTIAAEESVEFVDLDTDHAFPRQAFQDTHHLRRETVPQISSLIAERVFLPNLAR